MNRIIVIVVFQVRPFGPGNCRGSTNFTKIGSIMMVSKSISRSGAVGIKLATPLRPKIFAVLLKNQYLTTGGSHVVLYLIKYENVRMYCVASALALGGLGCNRHKSEEAKYCGTVTTALMVLIALMRCDVANNLRIC